MTFVLTVGLLLALGWALLRLTRLATGNVLTDVAVAWSVGGGAYAALAAFSRMVLGLRQSPALVLGFVALPVVVSLLVPRRARAAPARWLPRP